MTDEQEQTMETKMNGFTRMARICTKSEPDWHLLAKHAERGPRCGTPGGRWEMVAARELTVLRLREGEKLMFKQIAVRMRLQGRDMARSLYARACRKRRQADEAEYQKMKGERLNKHETDEKHEVRGEPVVTEGNEDTQVAINERTDI